MEKGLFTGWKSIFGFTLKQGTNEKFRKITTLVAVIFFVIGLAACVIMAAVQKKNNEKISPISTVYVVDDSELIFLDFNMSLEGQEERFPDVTFDLNCNTVEEAVKKVQEGEGKDVVLHLTHDDKGYNMELIADSDGQVSQGQGEDLLKTLQYSMEIGKIASSGIAFDKLAVIMRGTTVSTIDAGETEKSEGEELMRMLAPMLVIMLMYFLILLYGMGMANVVSVEKTSKLMEMMLTLTKPYALIFGKVLATTLIAFGQTILWLGCLIVGFFLGNTVAQEVVYDKFSNPVLEVIKLIGENGGAKAFSIGSIILFVICVFVAFLFYCLLAATFGSMAAKAEEINQVMMSYMILVIIGFFAAYALGIDAPESTLTIIRLIPISAAFKLPGDILIGNVTVLAGALYTLVLFAFTMILTVIAGKVYKNQLFHRGEGVVEVIKKLLLKKK